MFDYFKYEDFDSPDVRGSGLITHVDLIKMLDKARSIYGKPIYVTSGYRTELHNKEVGGVSNSSHLKGLAADISDNQHGVKIHSNNKVFNVTSFIKCRF